MLVSPVIAFAGVMALPSCWADRADARKPQQLETIAVAESGVADSVDELAALDAIAANESALCIRVHAGIDRGPGRGLWQLEGQQRRHAGPFVGLSLDATENAARVALFAWRHSWQCGHTLRDRFTAYAGKPCDTIWPGAEKRVATYWFVRGVMLRAERDAL